MKIAALIPLMLENINSVDFLNLIPNVEEHNLEFAELIIAMLKILHGSIRQHSGTRIRSWRIDRRTRSLWNLSKGTGNSWNSSSILKGV